MNRSKALVPAFTLLAAVLALPAGAAEVFVGTETCAGCHLATYHDFRVSGHPYSLSASAVARHRALPLPAGYSWDEIAYVIGGAAQKALYVGEDGYVITGLEDGTPGRNQYNVATGEWAGAYPGAVKPYDCGACHTTGYSPAGSQDGREGIVGTWVFEGVQCEACHGPSAHLDPGNTEVVDRSAAACGTCHGRGDTATIPAAGGFILNYTQYNELLASPHSGFACVDCHDPHKKSELSIRAACADCHEAQAQAYAGTVMDRWNVTCEDCHMPRAGRSAVASNAYAGDQRTHLFRIDTGASTRFFNPAGTAVLTDAEGQARVTVDFACLSCHTTETRAWAAFYARDFHGTNQVTQPNLPRIPKVRLGVFH